MIEVKTTVTQMVSEEIAIQLCEDFLEWVEKQGLKLYDDAGAPASEDPRSYAEMAAEFVEEYS